MQNKKTFIESVKENIPHDLVRIALKKRLEENGVTNRAATEAFLTHVLTGQEGVFEWSDGNGSNNETVRVEFTDQDGAELLEAMDEFVKEALPGLIQDSVNDGAKLLLNDLDERWPDWKLIERGEVRRFCDRIDLRWSKGLDPLRMMLNASRELGQEYADKPSDSQGKEEEKRKVISLLHARACQTTQEILTLLENGLADGAYARWRTLYEITVVALYISQSSNEAARRYVAHRAVSARDELENSYKFSGLTYEPTLLSDTEKKIEDAYQAVVNAYGKSFKGGYGWAAESLNVKSPNFGHLENAISWGKLPPEYKSASFKVHAGVAGLIRMLGVPTDEKVVLTGATNAGLQLPAISTAFSLLQITSLVLEEVDDFEVAVKIKVLIALRDRVESECVCAAQKLEKDELKVRAAFPNKNDQ